MERPDQRSGVEFLVAVLRRGTRAVKFAPFAYLVFYGIYLISEFWIPDVVSGLVDRVAYVPPIVMVAMVSASKMLKLCRWHRAACLIPGSSHVADYIDSFVLQFTQNEIICINTVIGILTLAFIALTYKQVFNGTKAGDNRSPQVLDIQAR